MDIMIDRNFILIDIGMHSKIDVIISEVQNSD